MSRWREWLQKSVLPGSNPMSSAQAGGVSAAITKALAAAGLMKGDAGASATPSYARPKPGARASDDRQFFWASSNAAAGTLDYKVFLPSGYDASSTPMPLIVMLHGCTQDPDDFAVGTRMNVLAEQRGFIVAYPMQPNLANSSKCWNWFRPEDQHRGRGEPQKIAGMVRDVIARYRVDPHRVYVAGLSAGAAMAVIMGRAYPELFAAVAAHSGLPYRSANNVVSALTVMKNARTEPASDSDATGTSNVPLIVFHGDRDATVAHANGTKLVEQTLVDWPRSQPLSMTSRTLSEGGRVCDRVIYRRPDGESVIEYWTIHGAGHHWAGGDPSGSHTDRQGPDASEHTVEFFLRHSRR